MLLSNAILIGLIEYLCTSSSFVSSEKIPPVLSGKYYHEESDKSSERHHEERNAQKQDWGLENLKNLNQNYITDCRNITKFKLGRESFLNYLIKLQTCDTYLGTRHMQDECNRQVYHFTTYYRVAYIHFCEPKMYTEICEGSVDTSEGSGEEEVFAPNLIEDSFDDKKESIISQEAEDFKNSENTFLLNEACYHINDYFEQIKNFHINVTGLSKLVALRSDGHDYHKIPVIDVAYDTLNKNETYIVPSVDFNEWFVPVVPFCKPYICVSSKDRYEEDHVSSYSCMPHSCRVIVVMVITIDIILAVVTVIANSLVLAVAARTKIMRNIPGYFKISLAVADLIVGAFVLPGSVYNAYTMYLKPMPWREIGQSPKPTDYFARGYLDLMGFFTVFPVCISLYTMGVASLDRYLAITKPFKYRQGNYLTKKRCIGVFTAIWLFGVVIAIFPIVSKEEYFSTGFTIFLSTGIVSVMVYAVGLGLPLIAVWSFNTAMLKNVCAGGEKRRSIRVSRPLNVNNNAIMNMYAAENVNAVVDNNHSTDFALDDKTTDSTSDNYVYQLSINQNNEDTISKQALEETTSSTSSRKTSSSSGNINYYRKEPASAIPQHIASPMMKSKNMKNRRQSLFNVVASTLHSNNNSNHSSRGRSPSAAMEKRLARTLSIMIGAFSLALVPCIVILLVGALIIKRITPSAWPEEYSVRAAVAIASGVYIGSRLILSNSFWNCIIYSVRNRHFRRAMFAVFLCSRRKIDRQLRQSSISSWKRRSSNAPDRHPVLSKANSASSGNSVASAPINGYGQSRRSTGVWSLSTVQSSRYNSQRGLNTRHIKSPVTKTTSLPDMTSRKVAPETNANEPDLPRRSSETPTLQHENGHMHRKLACMQSIERIEEE